MKHIFKLTLFSLLLFTCTLIIKGQQKVIVSTDPPPGVVQFPVLNRSGQSEVVFDEGKNEAIAQTRQVLVIGNWYDGDGVSLLARFVSTGKTVVKPKVITLVIYPFTKNEVYINDRRIKIFLGNKEILNSKSKLVRVNKGNVVINNLEKEISFNDFVKMCEANQIKMQIGPKALELTESEIRVFRDLLKTIEK